MRLFELSSGARGRVISLSGEGALRSRLKALGLKEGAEVELLKASPGKRTFLVRTKESVFALGREAAACVTVE